MTSPHTKHRPLFTRLWRSAIAGGVAAVVETVFFIGFINGSFHIQPIIANPMAFVAGTVVNYFMCRRWIFHKHHALHREMVQFGGIAFIGLIGEVITFTILFGLIGHPILSKLLTMGIMFFVNFSMKQRLFSSPERLPLVAQLRQRCARLPLFSIVHLFVRWHSCPIESVTAYLPSRGTMLDVGCGRGLVSIWAALSRPQLTIHGIDIDGTKVSDAITLASKWPRSAQKLTFTTVKPTAPLPKGKWNAIAFIDVLYLMKRGQQTRLLKQAAAQLEEKGVVIVKHAGTRPAWKVHFAALQEKLSVKVLGLTKGEYPFVFLAPEEIISLLRGAGLRTDLHRLDKGYPHPHVVIVGTKE